MADGFVAVVAEGLQQGQGGLAQRDGCEGLEGGFDIGAEVGHGGEKGGKMNYEGRRGELSRGLLGERPSCPNGFRSGFIIRRVFLLKPSAAFGGEAVALFTAGGFVGDSHFEKVVPK